MTDIKQQGNGGNTVGAKHVTIAYNALGQRTSLSRYESLATTSFVATTDYTFDTANRLSGLTHKRNTTTFAGYGYSYDGLSRLTSVNSSVEGVSNFTYDATSQLIVAGHNSQTDENYGYDLNGNRTSRSFLPERTLLRNKDSSPAGWNYSDEGNNALLEFNGSATIAITNHRTYNAYGRLVSEENAMRGPQPTDGKESVTPGVVIIQSSSTEPQDLAGSTLGMQTGNKLSRCLVLVETQINWPLNIRIYFEEMACMSNWEAGTTSFSCTCAIQMIGAWKLDITSTSSCVG